MKPLSLGHQNLIWSFIEYSEYITYYNDPIGDYWMKITNVDFNDFRIKYYYNFRSLCEARLVNTRSKLTASSYKPHSSADKLKITIKSDPVSSRFDIVTPFYI